MGFELATAQAERGTSTTSTCSPTARRESRKRPDPSQGDATGRDLSQRGLRARRDLEEPPLRPAEGLPAQRPRLATTHPSPGRDDRDDPRQKKAGF